LQLFARLETDRLTRGDIDLLAGTWITADTSLAGLNIENAEAAELDPIPAAQGVLHGLKYRFHGVFGLCARYICASDNCVDNVELDHTGLLLAEMEAYANTRSRVVKT
jgi:hypothetical protein